MRPVLNLTVDVKVYRALQVMRQTRNHLALVTEDGDVYYELSADNLSGIRQTVTVPASEIIHDRGACLWHPLVGVSPIYACGMSATMGARILRNSTRFFQNSSMVSGYLEAPGKLDDEEAAEYFKRGGRYDVTCLRCGGRSRLAR